MFKKRIDIDSTDWTPIAPLAACNGLALRNTTGVDVKIRTDANDASTEDVLNPGAQEEVRATPDHRGPVYAFSPNVPVFYAQMTVGTGTIVLTCAR